jgi:two-component system nitrate/nitrite response regulator NarL
MLERETDLKVVGQFASSTEALRSIEATTVDVAMLDVDLGAERALDFVVAAKEKDFEGKIMIVTAGITVQEAVQLVQAGVAGILHKQNSTEVLCNTIRRMAQGHVHLERDYLASLFRSVDQSRAVRSTKLTDRDKAVLHYILQGLSNRDIAERMALSEAAVKASLRQLFGKLNVRTRAQAVKVALEQYRDQL